VHDDELMVRIAKGEEAAFRLLVERWERPVHAFLWRMTGSRDEAMDLTQDTFLKVHGSAGRYKAEGKFRSWLFRIAGNLVRSWARRRKIISWISFDTLVHDRAGSGKSADDELVGKEIKAQVRQAIEALPDRQRQALILQRYHDLSQVEVAEAMQTTEAAVESLLQRAMKSLRRELADVAEG
jgi:RNA polymerase sigma-70 factor, ECF subfamily